LQMRPFTQGLEPLAEFVCVDAPSLAVGDFGWWHAVSRDGDDRSRRGSANRRCGTKDGRKRRIGWFRYLCKAPRSTAYSASVRELRSHRFLSVYGIPVKRKLASRLISQSWWVALPVTTAVTQIYQRKEKYGLPSVHIIGKSDFVVPSSRSDHLASFFKDPLIIRHSGGHVVPSDPQVRNSVATFLQERARDADLAYGNATRNG
jgi:Serine hydrolase (FSH1)